MLATPLCEIERGSLAKEMSTKGCADVIEVVGHDMRFFMRGLVASHVAKVCIHLKRRHEGRQKKQ